MLKEKFIELAWKHLDSLTKPKRSLGRLEEVAVQLVAIYENLMPELPKKVILVFAGDHGIVEEGVSAYPKEVTAQMVFNFLKGGAGINVLAKHAGAEVVVVDVGVDYEFENLKGLLNKKVVRGTKNFLRERAMSLEEAQKVIEVGKEAVKEVLKRGYNLIGLGDMGIGNTTASSAITAVITRRPVEEVTGKGTGITEAMHKKKIELIKRAIELHKPNPEDALDVLSKIGGAEIGAIAGACLACAENRIPALVDGFISSAGALIAYKIKPEVKDYLLASHKSEEIGHQAILDYLGIKPLLDLNLRLGEGTGAALAMLIVDGALKIYREMATFESAQVSTSIV